MADAFTTTSAVSTATAAYEQLAYWPLRTHLHFDPIATVKPTNATHRGSSVIFTIYDDLAVETDALNEVTDLEVVAMSDQDRTVTLVEYGNAVATTRKLRGTSFFSIDQDAANAVGYNASKSLDTLARTPLLAGTNVRFANGATSKATIAATDIMSGAEFRRARTFLANGNVMPVIGDLYKAYLAPDVSYDLRSETGDQNWRAPHVYSKPEEIWKGTIGAFEGFDVTETPRLGQAELPSADWADAGNLAVDVYPSLFLGKQCLAKAFSSTESGPLPGIEIGPVVDRLNRIHTLGWYWLGGYARFREESIYRVESASSIGANA